MELMKTSQRIGSKTFSCHDCGKKFPAGTSHKEWLWRQGGGESDPYSFSRVKICRDCEKYWKTRDPKPE